MSARTKWHPRKMFIIVGHLTPTDADADPGVQGKLDEQVEVTVYEDRDQAERQLLWYPDGVVREISV